MGKRLSEEQIQEALAGLDGWSREGNAIKKQYRLRKTPTPERLMRIGESWRPYRSVACWYLWASLGNAPLANTEEDPSQLSREERRVKVIFDRFDRFYRYKALFAFKRKYHPAWQGRYLAYPPGTLLARIGLAVAAVHLPGGFRGLIKS